MVRFRCIRSNGNARKRHETGNGNTGYPSCFRNGLTCFCHVSVYGFLQFRPVQPLISAISIFEGRVWSLRKDIRFKVSPTSIIYNYKFIRIVSLRLKKVFLCFSVHHIFKISLRKLQWVFNLIAPDLDANIARALKTSNMKKKIRWLDTIARLLSKKVYKQYKTIEFFTIVTYYFAKHIQFISSICTFYIEKNEISGKTVEVTLSFYSWKRSGNSLIILRQKIYTFHWGKIEILSYLGHQLEYQLYIYR